MSFFHCQFFIIVIDERESAKWRSLFHSSIKKTIAEAFSLDVVPPKCHYTIRFYIVHHMNVSNSRYSKAAALLHIVETWNTSRLNHCNFLKIGKQRCNQPMWVNTPYFFPNIQKGLSGGRGGGEGGSRRGRLPSMGLRWRRWFVLFLISFIYVGRYLQYTLFFLHWKISATEATVL